MNTDNLTPDERAMLERCPVNKPCKICGHCEDDSTHIRYGNDLDNPVKHIFEPMDSDVEALLATVAGLREQVQERQQIINDNAAEHVNIEHDLREKLAAVVEALEATLGYIEYNADEKDERDVYAKATAALAKAKEGQ